MLKVAVVDYGRGNIHSVVKALTYLGCQADVVADPTELPLYGPAILPGVGSFSDAMATLQRSGLDAALQDHVQMGKPLLGVCLGLQLLLEAGSEGGASPGLGVIPGAVMELQATGLKIPHIGWSPVSFPVASPLTAGLGDQADFYFVHSYAAFPTQRQHWLGETTYGQTFAAIAGNEMTFGTQFHPEKSGVAGLRLLRNFVALAGGDA